MNSEEISLSSLSDEDPKLADDERSRSRSKEHRHKHKKKHKRHSHKHKHRHKSSSRKERKHKKHRSRHRRKDSSSSESREDDAALVDTLLETGLGALGGVEALNPPGEIRGRDVEIMRSSTGNGILESMKIVVNNQNGSRNDELVDTHLETGLSALGGVEAINLPLEVRGRNVEIMRSSTGNSILESMKIVVNNQNGSRNDEFVTTVVSSEEQEISEDTSRDGARKVEDVSMDSSDYLYIGEDLNLEELMKQKAALQACLGAYMSDVEDEEREAVVEKPQVVEEEEEVEEGEDDDDDDEVEITKVSMGEVVTVEDSDDEDLKKKERKKERDTKPKKRKLSSVPIFPRVLWRSDWSRG